MGKRPHPVELLLYKSKKKLNKKVKILHGKGILGTIKKRVSVAFTHNSKEAPQRFMKTVDSLKDFTIVRVRLTRSPIKSGKALNVLTLGKFNERKREEKYDGVYHNYLLVTVSNGITYRIEKNQVAEIKATRESPAISDQFDLSIPSATSIFQLLEKAHHSFPDLYEYHPQSNNCQVFVQHICNANGIRAESPESQKALNGQDANKLLSGVPTPLKSVPSSLTKIAAWGDRVIHGGSLMNYHRFHHH